MASQITWAHFQSCDFGEWSSQLANAVGHHKSERLSSTIPFATTIDIFRCSELSVVELSGCSPVRLHRFQAVDQVVLWLPRQGWVMETLNGQPLVAEPGTAMLCFPGDEMLGETTSHVQGVSVIIPASLLGEPSAWQGLPYRHLANSADAVTVIETAIDVVAAMKHSPGAVAFLRAALIDQLCFWRQSVDPKAADMNYASIERRRLISLAREWIHSRLDQPFLMGELAAALNVSSRNLQYCFCQELGHSPVMETRKIRFRKLRELLLSSTAGHERMEDVFQRCGLPYSSVIRRHYHNWCGESPQQTQSRATNKG